MPPAAPTLSVDLPGTVRYKATQWQSMSPRSQQLRRLLHPWLKRLKAERSGLPSFFFLSIVIHAAFLWRFSFISRHEPRPFSLSKIAIVAGLADEVEAFPSAEPTQTRALQSTRAVRKSASPGVHTPTSSRSEASPSAGDTPTGGESSVGSGNVSTDSGGIGFAGQGSPTGALGAKESAPSSGAGSGPAKGKPQPGKGAPSAAERSVIAVPPSIQRTTSPYESEVYAEVDFYTLFTPDLRSSVNVPANQVCLEGNIIRTYERQVISHTITDISKCRYEDYSDKDEMRCPKEAQTTVVTYNNFLSSPVSYSVNVCAAYDRSSCYWDAKDDGPEREICRVPGKYEGIWAAGTMFHYPCVKSSTQSFSHPLQYEIRYMQDIEFPEGRTRRRVVLREKRPVAACQ